jgi:hypothetical protein
VWAWEQKNYQMNECLSLVHLTSRIGPQSSASDESTSWFLRCPKPDLDPPGTKSISGRLTLIAAAPCSSAQSRPRSEPSRLESVNVVVRIPLGSLAIWKLFRAKSRLLGRDYTFTFTGLLFRGCRSPSWLSFCLKPGCWNASQVSGSLPTAICSAINVF